MYREVTYKELLIEVLKLVLTCAIYLVRDSQSL